MLVANAIEPVAVVFPSSGVFVLESRHAPGFRMGDACHDYWKVLCPFSGAGELVNKAARYRLQAGDVALVPPGARHRIEDEGGKALSLYAVCIRPEVLAQVGNAAGKLGRLCVHRRPAWGGEVQGLLRRLLIEQTRRAEGAEALVNGLVWLLLGTLWRAAGNQSEPAGKSSPPADDTSERKSELVLQRVAEYHRELPRVFHGETGVDAAAARLGLGRRRFTQLFRDVAGESWLQAVRRLRVEHARHLLRETNRSVAAVAFEAGFSDLSNFYRAFRDMNAGASPEAWRRKHAGGSNAGGAAAREMHDKRRRS